MGVFMARRLTFVASSRCLSVLILLGCAAQATADTIEWTDPNSGLFDDAGNWTVTAGAGAPPPAAGDTVNFNEIGTYTVTLMQNEASDILNVIAGDVTFVSDSATVRTYALSTGGADANINDGNLTIGQANFPVRLNLGDPFASALQIGNGSNGNVTVQGAGSVLDASGFPNHVIGEGAFGSLSVVDNATAFVGIFGTLRVGVSTDAATTGSVQVNTGGTLNIGDTLIATNNSNASGGIEVFFGSSISQLTTIDATLEIGSSTGGNGAVFVHGGTYDSGTGQTTVNSTGTIFVELGGTFNANGPLTMNSGSTLAISDGFFTANGGFDNSAEGTIDVFEGTLTVTAGAFVPNAGGATDDYSIEGVSGVFHLAISDTATANIGRDLYIGDFGDGELTVAAGGSVSSRSGFLGDGASAMGTATIDGMDSTWTLVEDLDVGSEGTGELTIQNGGVVENNLGRIATDVGSVGTVVIDGLNSTWTNDFNLAIAIAGTGSLTVQNQGTVVSGLGRTSINPGSDANVTVQDAGSSWTINDDLVLAQGGTATLQILSGGLVTTTVEAFVGNGSMSDGTVLVDGEDSTWNNLGDLTTGLFGGSATITLQNAGSIDNVNALLSNNASATTDVTVDGTGSSWHSSDSLYVGGNDVAAGGTAGIAAQNGGHVQVDGTLKVWNTGTVTIDGGSIVAQSFDNTDDGLLTFFDGTLTIDSGALAPNAGGPADDFVLDGNSPGDLPHLVLTAAANASLGADLIVGDAHQSQMTIQNGATVSNAVGFIGSASNSTGTATVDGAGSTWTNSGNLTVGDGGTGTLTIQDGGAVSNGTGRIGDDANSIGMVTVTDPNSTWTNTNGLRVGDSGNGTLNILNGGAVSSTSGIISNLASSTSTATVDGAGSVWTNTFDLNVGISGNGTLNILNGGAVSSTSGVIGDVSGSNAGVSVTGTDGASNPSKWMNSGNLTVGNSGSGNLFIADGGVVENSIAEIGSQLFGDGSASIVGTDGAGNPSTWDVLGLLTVGKAGTGSLGVSDGALVNSLGASIAAVPGSTGSTIIDGTDGAGTPSRWESLGSLFVADGGSGTLSITGGAEVFTVGVFIGDDLISDGTVTVSGTDGLGNPSELESVFGLTVGRDGTGALTVDAGGLLTTTSGSIANNIGSNGTATVSGAGSSLTASIRLTVGGTQSASGGAASLTVEDQALVDVAGLLKVWDTASVTLTGATIAFESLDVEPGATFDFNFGVLNDTDDLTITSGDGLQTALGGAHEVVVGQELRVDGTTTLHTTFTINGGILTTGDLASSQFLQINAGTLNLTQADLTIGFGGLFGPVYVLGSSRQINVTNTTTIDVGSLLVVEEGGSFSAGTLNNNGELMLGGAVAIVGGTTFNNAGLIRGLGRINALVSNSGVIEALDQPGELIFSNAVTNETTGLIAIRNSAVRFSQGLANDGQLSFGPGNSDLLGDVTNDGTIGLSGDAIVSVVGDVTQNVTLNLLSNSKLIVFDDFSGVGGSTGPGTLEVLGTLSPGASPAEVSFGGDLVLGARTLIELGGTEIGQFDRLLVGGETTLSGLLDVVLIDAFTPELGNSFEIFVASGGVLGTFAVESLPDLGALLAMDVSYDATTITLAVVPALDGDFNIDGVVNGFDFLAWQRGESPNQLSQSDLNDWKANYGTAASLSASSAVVPEPNSLGLLCLGGLLALSRFRCATAFTA